MLIYKLTNLQIMKQYIMPQTQAQFITTGQIICAASPVPSIEKGQDLDGSKINPG